MGKLVATEHTETCAEGRIRDFVLDNLAFVSDPACETDANVFDSGFEQAARPPGATPWTLETYDDEPNATVALGNDANAAHTGNVAALFSVSTPCPHVSVSSNVTIPTRVGAAGAALKFWYRTGAVAHAGLDVSLSALLAPVSLPATATWTQVTACLDGRLAGRPDLLRFLAVSTDGGGLCANTFPNETFAIDDVELTSDASCPAR